MGLLILLHNVDISVIYNRNKLSCDVFFHLISGIKTLANSWFHRPSVLFWISITTQVTCTYITWLPQPIEITSVTTRPSSHVLEVSIKTPKEILFCKQTRLYALHAKWELVARGHLALLCQPKQVKFTNCSQFLSHICFWLRFSFFMLFFDLLV